MCRDSDCRISARQYGVRRRSWFLPGGKSVGGNLMIGALTSAKSPQEMAFGGGPVPPGWERTSRWMSREWITDVSRFGLPDKRKTISVCDITGWSSKNSTSACSAAAGFTIRLRGIGFLDRTGRRSFQYMCRRQQRADHRLQARLVLFHRLPEGNPPCQGTDNSPLLRPGSLLGFRSTPDLNPPWPPPEMWPSFRCSNRGCSGQ